MTCTFEKFVSQKCFVLIASNSDDDVIPRIHFETDYDHDVGLTTPEQQIACRSIKFEEDGVTYTSLPIVFDLTCRISQEDCHLTTEDDEDNEQPITSCWLQPCPDDISGVEWARMLRRISSIISNTGEKVDLSKLFRYSEKIGNVQLQIGKHVLHDRSDIVLSDMHSRGVVPTSAADIPFDRPVRAMFYLKYGASQGLPLATASLLSICGI